MPLVRFLPDNRLINVDEGETILQAAARAGLALTHFCGGNARCSTCRVVVVQGVEHCLPRPPEEQAVADMLKLPPPVRLACRTLICGDVTVRPLVTDPADVDLGSLYIRGVDPLAMGVEKLVLILFADIEGFTAFAEDLLPYDVIYALNVYFHRVGEVIHSHGGHIDTYMGDGFMALFETGDLTEGAVRAVRAGLELIRTVEELSPYFQELYGKRFSLRVGLHYGQVVAGKLGAPGHKKMTVIGDAVNLASRIEAANKQAGTRFLMSSEVSALVEGRVHLGRRVQVTLPGKSGEYTLWEVLGLQEEDDQAERGWDVNRG